MFPGPRATSGSQSRCHGADPISLRAVRTAGQLRGGRAACRRRGQDAGGGDTHALVSVSLLHVRFLFGVKDLFMVNSRSKRTESGTGPTPDGAEGAGEWKPHQEVNGDATCPSPSSAA